MEMNSRTQVSVKLVDPTNLSEIVDKDNHAEFISMSRQVSSPTEAYSGVEERVIPIDFSVLNSGRYMKVGPGRTVPVHAHTGPVFRLITSGEAKVNGKTYLPGDWMLIPAGVEYEIESSTGYEGLWICVKCSNA